MCIHESVSAGLLNANSFKLLKATLQTSNFTHMYILDQSSYDP